METEVETTVEEITQVDSIIDIVNFDSRIIWITKALLDEQYTVARQIVYYNECDEGKSVGERTPIRLMIACSGGTKTAADVICNAIEASSTPIIGCNMGDATSAAFNIFLCCHRRYTFPNAHFMTHYGSMCVGEMTMNELHNVLRVVDAEAKRDKQRVLANTNITSDQYDEMMIADWYMSAEEAVELGVAEKIVKSFDEVI